MGNKEFGEALQALLASKGRSSGDLMRKLEDLGFRSSRGKAFDRSTISRWITGDNSMPLILIPSILEWLEASDLEKFGIFQLRTPNLNGLKDFEGLEAKLKVLKLAYSLK
tara:strand:+ start:9704 stop:10033 length:330 start_codon:yes stop_codon:yes gene_type:complete